MFIAKLLPSSILLKYLMFFAGLFREEGARREPVVESDN